MREHLVHADGTLLQPDEKTAIANLLLHAMWSQIEIYFNRTLVSTSNSHYPWEAYVKSSIASSNNGLKMCWLKLCESNVFEVDVRIKMYRSNSSLIVMSAENSLDYRYSLNHMKVKINTMAKGSLELSWDTMCPALRPSWVVIGLLEQRAVKGDYKTNPLDFQNFNASEVHLCINGIHVLGSPLKLDFRNRGGNATAHDNLFEICSENNGEGKLAIHKPISITVRLCMHLVSIHAHSVSIRANSSETM